MLALQLISLKQLTDSLQKQQQNIECQGHSQTLYWPSVHQAFKTSIVHQVAGVSVSALPLLAKQNV